MADLDIAAFLRARLDEREAKANGALSGPWVVEEHTYETVVTVDGGQVVATVDGLRDGWHIADNDPAFVLADVVAKRRLIAGHGPGRVVDESDGRWASDPDSWDPPWTKCTGHEWAAYPCETVRLLALPYAGHAEFREEWKL